MFFEQFSGSDGSLECSSLVSKVVVDLRGGAVEAERNHLDTCFFHLFADSVRDEGAICSHAHSKTLICPVFCYLEDILSEKRLSP